jgi:YgiT-type zinc finger domain-containing protein
MNHECPVCHHAMTAALVRHVQTWHDTMVIFENVPAEVCEQCGEQLFTGAVVDRLNSRLWSLTPPTRTIAAAVYDLAVVGHGGERTRSTMQEICTIWYTPGRRYTYATIPNATDGSLHRHPAPCG